MRETIPPDVVAKVQEICKKGEYDGDKFIIPVGENAPCSITQIYFPDVIDLALEHLKRKASTSLVEFVENEPTRPSNIEYVTGEGHKLKNKLLPQFDWSLITPTPEAQQK